MAGIGPHRSRRATGRGGGVNSGGKTPGRLDCRRTPDWALPTCSRGVIDGDFAITSHGSALYFLSGELDVATVPLMEVAIEDAVARGGPITLDMTDVTFADSSGIGAIMKSVKSLPASCLVLHGVHDEVGRVIEMMGIRKGLPTLHVIPCLPGGEPGGEASVDEVPVL